MKKLLIYAGLIMSIGFTAGTASAQEHHKKMSSQAKGAIIGGVGGAVVGGIIGHGVGGAAIGGAIGAGGGYVIGNEHRRHEEKERRAAYRAAYYRRHHHYPNAYVYQRHPY